ncbi:short chain dehydrogenase family protein [Colletotrichum kahawae]|uniref:Short chain dehydrogenase family protein n=1 Tax=Colletotrichum kahawae TaxID=34407 RepID=A0AAE0D6C7_COLKA|nr:short chain dehydrogenase family protein [Colletotrichum camelliae]KAK2754134.1 short chain dehydrogenase family protein [Colletotrichum kahawae]
MADPYPFKDMVIAVTGASRGTGLALARYLLIRGAKVSMCATTAENLAKALEGIEKDIPDAKGRVMTKVVDIKEHDMVKAWIDETVETFGKLDGAANVAAREQREIFPITDLPEEYFKEILVTNVFGTFLCMKEEMRNMKDGGSIVNVGSITSNYASAGVSAYVSSKHALLGITKVAAFEGANRGIRVNALCPGCIDTDMMHKPFNSPSGQFWLTAEDQPCLTRRLAEPWEVAAAIAFLLGPEGRFVNKATWYVDGGWTEGSFSKQ